MISVFRKYTQNNVLKFVLWATMFSLVAGIFFGTRFPSSASRDSIGKVNGYDISRTDFIRRVTQEHALLQKIKEQLGENAELFLKMQGYNQNSEEQVLDTLINEKLLQSAAKDIGAVISSDYKNSKVTDPAFIMDSFHHLIPQQALLSPGSLSLQTLVRYLQREGVSDEEFEKAVDNTLQRLLINEILASTLYIPQSAIKEHYIRLYSKKKYALLSLALDDYVKKIKAEKPLIDQEDLKAFFTTYSNTYLVPEKRKGMLWVFSPENYGISVSDKELEEFYLKNKKTFIETPEEVTVKRILIKTNEKDSTAVQEQKRKQLEEARQTSINNLEKFEEIAQTLSQAPKSEKTLTFKRGQTNNEKARQAAVFALKQDGAISPIIETQEGYEFLKQISRKDPLYKDLAQVKDEITKQLQQAKFVDIFNKDAQRVLSQSQQTPTIFTNFIKNKKAVESSLEGVTDDKSIQARKLFSLKEPNKTFYQEDGKGFIIQALSVQKSFLPELTIIKDRVLSDYYKKLAQQALKADLDQVQAQLKAGMPFDSINKGLKVPGALSTTNWLDPQVPKSFKELEDKQINIKRLMALTRARAVLQEITLGYGYSIELQEIEPINEQDFEQKQDEIRRLMEKTEISYLQYTLLQALRSRATIAVNPELTKLIKSISGR